MAFVTEDSSVFLQESDSNLRLRLSQETGTASQLDISEDDCTLTITTSMQQTVTRPVPAASPTSPAAPHVLETITVSHSPHTLHDEVATDFTKLSATTVGELLHRQITDAQGRHASTVVTALTTDSESTPLQGGATKPASETFCAPPTAADDNQRRTAQLLCDSDSPLTADFRGVQDATTPSAGGSGGRMENQDSPHRIAVREKPLIPENMVKGKKGVAAPLPLSAMPKSQLRVAPTGRSDSDTDDTDDSESVSTGPSSPPHRRTQEEEDEDEQQFVDEFGFVIDEDAKKEYENFIRGIDGKQVARREVKWANMAADWARTNSKMHAKLKERCRKGIPSRLRGVAWQLLTGSRSQMMSAENAGVYVALRDKKLRDKEVDDVLGRDLTRTFPNHILFKDEGGIGQTFLRNVLHAYAGCDPEVGYTQGMAFIVGMLSTQMAEEESFWALHELMYNERYKMRELYKPGFPLLHQFFYQMKRLLAKLLPKLSKRFDEYQIDPSFYASQWFMTLFVYHFPFRAVLRICDVFFSEGWKIIFRTGIALLKWEEKRLLSMAFDELLPTLKILADGKDTKELLRRAHRVKFKTADLNRYGDEYWAMKGTTLE